MIYVYMYMCECSEVIDPLAGRRRSPRHPRRPPLPGRACFTQHRFASTNQPNLPTNFSCWCSILFTSCLRIGPRALHFGSTPLPNA